MSERSLRGIWLGRRRYQEVFELQERLLLARHEGRVNDLVLLLEHEPVISRGRGAKSEHLLASPESLAEHGIELVTTNRGGDVTLHAPGQLVAYPIVDLSPDRRDVRRWVKNLTESMRRLTLELGIASGSHEKHVGLWADAAAPHRFSTAEAASTPVKIGAIGVRISHWITMHGFALNLDPQLELYRAIIPCGIREHGVSSIRALGGAEISVERAAERALTALAEVTESVAGSLVSASDVALADIEAELRTRAA
jgi:lipoyl(octanoyl) transferase